MANPSTVNATASGKEVLRRTFFDNVSESGDAILTAPTNHICTILSIILLERNGLTDAQFDLVMLPDGGSALYLAINQPVTPAYGTFVWSDRFVITGGDVLKVTAKSAGGTANFDVWCSYIDQDWT